MSTAEVTGHTSLSRGLRLPPLLVTVLVTALVLNVVGLVLLGSMLAERRYESRVSEVRALAQVGPLFLTVERAEWLGRSRSPQAVAGPPGNPYYLMHSAPPNGQKRVRIEASLRNKGEDARSFGLDEFTLRSDQGGAWPLRPGSFQPARLMPGQVLYLDLFFDIPEAESNLFLVWSRDGDEASTVRIPVGSRVRGQSHR